MQIIFDELQFDSFLDYISTSYDERSQFCNKPSLKPHEIKVQTLQEVGSDGLEEKLIKACTEGQIEKAQTKFLINNLHNGKYIALTSPNILKALGIEVDLDKLTNNDILPFDKTAKVQEEITYTTGNCILISPYYSLSLKINVRKNETTQGFNLEMMTTVVGQETKIEECHPTLESYLKILTRRPTLQIKPVRKDTISCYFGIGRKQPDMLMRYDETVLSLIRGAGGTTIDHVDTIEDVGLSVQEYMCVLNNLLNPKARDVERGLQITANLYQIE